MEIGGYFCYRKCITNQKSLIMPDEKHWDKLGDVYVEKTPQRTRVITLGIIGRYYTAGHNLETAMWNEQRKTELGGIHTLIIRTWRQLMDISKTCEPTGE